LAEDHTRKELGEMSEAAEVTEVDVEQTMDERPPGRPSVFAVAIREARYALGVSQEELGRRLGLERARVSHIESGRHMLGERTILRIAKALGLRPSEMLAHGEGGVEDGSDE